MSTASKPHVALAGNPNSGKSTIFNALTGLRQKVANYPGVTVEKKEGSLRLSPKLEVDLIDLPGTYSLNPRSLDEEVAHDVILGLRKDTPPPNVIVAVVDASNLERNLFLATQLISTGCPTIIALNMMDIARSRGFTLNTELLAKELKVPVIPMSASRGQGFDQLKQAIQQQLTHPVQSPDPLPLSPTTSRIVEDIARQLVAEKLALPPSARGEALRLLSSESILSHPRYHSASPSLASSLTTAREQLNAAGQEWNSLEADTRYQWIETILARVCRQREMTPAITDKIDRVMTHRFLGPLSLVILMLGIFISIYVFAQIPMDAIDGLFTYLSGVITQAMPDTLLRSLLTDGIISGVGSVLIFLPQILMLFFFISILEDTGYMARAAFIMDRVMGRVGLHGKAFIPLLSSFACAIPGVMAARTIENVRDRLVTILVAPLMCCSARWPVYFLLAGAFIPPIMIAGFIPLPALVMFCMVLFGIITAILIAGILKKTLFRGETPALLLELPPYRIPSFKTVLHTMWERGWLFVKNAGTIILAISIILWALASFPRQKDLSPEQQIRQSYAGKMGRALEPVLEPLGFDWKIGIAIITSFAAREVFVSSMGTIYGISSESDDGTTSLETRLKQEKDPATGKAFYTPLRAVSLMVFYVLAMQCMSTIAAVKRETNGWKWALFQLVYMTGLAWIASFSVWQGGHLLGWQ